jgi:type VI secretion system protein VasG
MQLPAWLLLLEQGEGDLTVLPDAMNGMDAVWQSLLSWLDAQPRSVRTRPELSALQTLKKWLCRHARGDEQIRSIHLLTAMVENRLTTLRWPLA